MEQTKWRAIAEITGSSLSDAQLHLLLGFRDWLVTEALPAGGIGPNEVPRLDRRHITDSLLFARCLPIDQPEVSDLGSGVGLPGIPLAILRSKTHFRLIDRSQRRVDLMKRAVRVLDLANVDVVHKEIGLLENEIGFITSRATITPDQAFPLFSGLLAAGGTAALGGSWSRAPTHKNWETLDVAAEILDLPVWILIMHRQ